MITGYQAPDAEFKALMTEACDRLIAQHFPPETHISGEAILHFCPHQQINKFVLFQIYQEWNAHSGKLNHPYFDFKHPEVRQAMQGLQNILSRHILVSKYDFRAMLEKSLYNSARLTLNPVDSFLNFFFQSKEFLPIALFEKYADYFSDYDFIINSILAHHKRANKDRVEKQTFVEQVERVVKLFEEKGDFNLEAYRAKTFQAITGRDLQSLLNQNAVSPAPERREEPPLPNFQSKMAQIKQDASGMDGDSYFDRLDKMPPAPETPVYRPTLHATPNETTPNRLADRFQNAQGGNLNDRLKAPKQKLTFENIPMHLRFSILQKVFTGNTPLFKDTMEAIARMNAPQEAEDYLRTRILNRPGVNREDPAVVEFLEMIKSQF